VNNEIKGKATKKPAKKLRARKANAAIMM
jgi:hypothetical protein